MDTTTPTFSRNDKSIASRLPSRRHAWRSWNWRRNAVPIPAEVLTTTSIANRMTPSLFDDVSRSSADALFDFDATLLTAHVATPMELAMAPLDHRSSNGVVASAAAHQLAAVGRVRGRRTIARPSAGSERSGPRVLLAEVRRGAEVDEVGVGRLP